MSRQIHVFFSLIGVNKDVILYEIRMGEHVNSCGKAGYKCKSGITLKRPLNCPTPSPPKKGGE
jgi:hypothetical protein